MSSIEAEPGDYVRIYYSVIDDTKFADVYDNDQRWATYTRLLMAAEGMYPAPAPIPANTRKAALAHLVSVGIIDLAPGNRFRIHGLAAERERRSKRGRAGATARWDSGRNATALPTHSDRIATALRDHPHRAMLDETRRDETSKDETRRDENKEVTPTTASSRSSSDPSNEPRLSADQLAAWADFGSEWGPFKTAWLGRGFLWPPSGEKDAEGTQRAMLFEVVDSRPKDIGGWIAEAKGKSPREVIAHVLNRWHGIREGLLHDPDRPNRSSRSTGMSAIGAVIPSVIGKP